MFTCINKRFCTLFRLWWGQRNPPGTTYTRAVVQVKWGDEIDSSSWMLKPVYFAFVKTMLEYFLQTTHFVKSRAHSPRPTSKIIAMIALRRAILMKANSVVSLHAHRLFSGRACSCKKDPCLYRHECFTGKYATRKIHKNYIRDPSGLFSIISHVSLSMT